MRYFASRSASRPNCVDDFYLVAIAHKVLRMLAPGHDLAIDFHRDRAPAIAIRIEQRSDADGFGQFARHAVQLDFRHLRSLTVAVAGAKRAIAHALNCGGRKSKRPDEAGRLRWSCHEPFQWSRCFLSSSFLLSFGGGGGVRAGCGCARICGCCCGGAARCCCTCAGGAECCCGIIICDAGAAC